MPTDGLVGRRDSASESSLGNRVADQTSPVPPSESGPPRGVPTAAVLAVLATVVAAALLVTLGPNRHTASPNGSTASVDAIVGSWQLVSASNDGQDIDLAAAPTVRLNFRSDRTVVIDDGINATTASVTFEVGSFGANFVGKTFVGEANSDSARVTLLAVLDSLAPSQSPSAVATSDYRIAGDVLVIQAPAGELTMKRMSASSAPPATASATPQP